ncbi:hypothetical protein [Rubellimicrobium roseum]|uniref:HAD family hydrolase n=1 Tax=Rubellimicrobium roseum TaxID=687525 RepID=A0A5C4NIB7_9RHOB|nr:hypothetical protein [Rubellimicrobium roseum]TNC72169.1 hypothetical protein FHG71_08935 [Rubellimicrobium roseum]
MPKLFLDCDGVLADFDAYATEILGLPPREFEARHGRKAFWSRIAGHEDFFFKLPLMPDARELWSAVEHLHPVILTGTPLGTWAAPQKMRWAARHFPQARMITTMARAKREHMEAPGDVLVDDTLKYRPLWEEAGGVFVPHRSARESLAALRALGFDLREG